MRDVLYAVLRCLDVSFAVFYIRMWFVFCIVKNEFADEVEYIQNTSIQLNPIVFQFDEHKGIMTLSSINLGKKAHALTC